jgi:hypothetical protein
MRTAYKVLAWLVALGVVVQAASMVWAVAGLGIWIDKEGGVFDKASAEAMFEGDVTFTGVAGFMIHGMNGMMVIPALALILLIVSFFAKVPGGIAWAAYVLGAVVVQVALGLFGHENAIFGMLHGVNALILFSLAVYAGLRVRNMEQRPAAMTAAEREHV